MSKPKELNFFIEERNWPRGVDWYKAHFDAEARVRGEASPNYTAFPQHEGVPERMASVVPDAKLIYMVRDPLERIAAHWVHNYAKRREKGTLAETLDAPEHLLRHPLASTRCSSSASSRTTRRSRSSSSSSPSCATSGWRRCARCSSSSASTPTSTTRASSRSATRPRARPGRPGSRCGSRSSAAAAAGGCFPSNFWLVLDDRLPLRRAIKRPDVRASLPAGDAGRAARRRRAPARAHRPRLLQLDDLGRLSPARRGRARRCPRTSPTSSSTTTPAGPGRCSACA